VRCRSGWSPELESFFLRLNQRANAVTIKLVLVEQFENLGYGERVVVKLKEHDTLGSLVGETDRIPARRRERTALTISPDLSLKVLHRNSIERITWETARPRLSQELTPPRFSCNGRTRLRTQRSHLRLKKEQPRANSSSGSGGKLDRAKCAVVWELFPCAGSSPVLSSVVFRLLYRKDLVSKLSLST
jgi:hypothetical protein